MLYPLKFKKVFIEKIWGGQGFKEILNMTIPNNKRIGESWEISAHTNGMSVVENGFLEGKTLQELLEIYKEQLVGEKIYKNYKNIFPLLIKYLNVNDRLSIQVHPNDEIANKYHNELGKSESWYIIDASPDATIIMGLKKGITKEIFLEKTKNNDFNDLFNEISVKKGDFIDINPGTVHATLKGNIVFAEIQQNSDITYRIYDFDRLENGKKRELHLEKAAESIDYEKEIVVNNTDFKEKEKKIRLVKKKYYSIDKIKIENIFNDINNDSLIIYSIFEGNGILKSKDCSFEIKKGESILIPPSISISLEGNFEILRTIIE